MAITNHERVGKAMDLLQGRASRPFVEREFKSQARDRWSAEVTSAARRTTDWLGKGDRASGTWRRC